MTIIQFRETEQGFTDAVIDLARTCGFLVHHDRPARTAHGYRTAIQGDIGFPDLVCVGWGRQIVAELKVGTNRLSYQQREWVDRFHGVPGVETFVWYPCDWPAIEACFLRKNGPRCVP